MTTTTKVAKTTETKNTKKAQSSKGENTALTNVNAKNLEKVAKSYTTGEVALTKMKYNYPEDCDTPEKRKSFRVKARKMVTKLEEAYTEAINSGSEKAIRKTKQALRTWQQENYLPDYSVNQEAAS